MSSTSGNYGSVTNSAPVVNGDSHAHADEEQPLLGGGGGARKPASKSLRKKLTTDVQRDWADLVLLACYIITGLLDSSSISIWGSFVSMQTGKIPSKPSLPTITARSFAFHSTDTEQKTGNTVYIGLGLAAPTESTRWIKSATSLISFCLGSFFFSRFHRFFSPKKRWVLCASFIAQTLLCVAAAVILTVGPAAGKDEIAWNVLVPIALIAFQSCGQAVTSRALKYNALTSVVLTSIYCDLFSDAELFSVHNAERNRRVGAPVLLLVGAICGGLFAHSSLGIAGALWTAAFLKFLIVLSWFFWPGEPTSDEE
ncbi:hypothetical protein CPAR01_07858 [Colletotrichum paranaense]|uniref:DUF1275 domain-containing protein n=2 Tax=Colletotrichum acutatum species complex TaxID=2707335 RepID=A0AAI9XLE3_9PEZI|nr:uncharacterized protein CPAR01_07858 [Colletotrichum paranaense]KAK1453299.1 hypothetical protein CMEL01_04958 [Colletotrichum melonis]KAK1537745.1 hypothetical protein CPAR01_07858 [Colletotrichum paranaense]